MIILSGGCNAPRLNPLDPENDTDLKILSGQVFNRSYKPIDNVKVIWETGGKLTFTDAKGKFTLGPLKKTPGYLYFEKDGFGRDSLFIDFENPNIQDPILLNSIPHLDSLEFYSIIDNTYFIPDNRVVCRVKLSDDDNTIKSVYITKDTTEGKKELPLTSTGFYEKSFKITEFKETSLDQLIGKDFQFWIIDSDSAKFNIGKYHIKRIIKQSVVTNKPSNYDTVSVPFKLTWDRFLPGFNFKYEVQIFPEEGTQAVLFDRFVSSDSISITVNNYLPSGTYKWAIWSIDEFLNRNASDAKHFVVE